MFMMSTTPYNVLNECKLINELIRASGDDNKGKPFVKGCQKGETSSVFSTMVSSILQVKFYVN